ncbi:MAG: hypothetical protein ABR923_14480 [Terracidiphilus sp.]|jgi:hypothetical protein
MSIVRRVFFTACLSVFACVICAQEAKPLVAVPEGSFKFQGSWDCAGSFGNGKTHKSTFSGSVILGGKWLELGEQDIEPHTGYLAKYLIGYDAQQKRLVEFDANNFGAATYGSADGWQNGVLTMTSPVSADAKALYAANRFVYSITAPDSFTVDWQVAKTVALNWVSGDHLVCKRNEHA